METPIIIYDQKTGDVEGFGYIKDPQLLEGQAVEDFKGPGLKHRVDFYRRIAPGVLEEKSDSEKETILKSEEFVAQAQQAAPIKFAILQAFGAQFTMDDLAKADKELEAICEKAPMLLSIVRYFAKVIQS